MSIDFDVQHVRMSHGRMRMAACAWAPSVPHCERFPIADLRQELAVVKRSESQPVIKPSNDLPSPPSMPSMHYHLDTGVVKGSIVPIPEVDSNRLAEDFEGGIHMVAPPGPQAPPKTPGTSTHA